MLDLSYLRDSVDFFAEGNFSHCLSTSERTRAEKSSYDSSALGVIGGRYLTFIAAPKCGDVASGLKLHTRLLFNGYNGIIHFFGKYGETLLKFGNHSVLCPRSFRKNHHAAAFAKDLRHFADGFAYIVVVSIIINVAAAAANALMNPRFIMLRSFAKK